jgi:hypothetical protein
LFDPNYDTYESLQERTPWTFDTVLAIAGKIRSGTGPLSPAFYKCLDEAQGIARSSMFGPVVRKEAVMGPSPFLSRGVPLAPDLDLGMLLLAAWSTNGWIPSGHAMRMALELGLHRALDKLAEERKRRTEEEERDLGGGGFLDLLLFPLLTFQMQLFLRVSGCVCIGSTISASGSS